MLVKQAVVKKIGCLIMYQVSAIYPNVFKGRLTCSYKRNKNLADYLVSAKLK